ncbi:hypothetical protein BC828DRAFT_407986 [Blastocladiella britannica]|nr:hypothetical protein BC828DRAFT_407986 [Blastocladiella britannica]
MLRVLPRSSTWHLYASLPLSLSSGRASARVSARVLIASRNATHAAEATSLPLTTAIPAAPASTVAIAPRVNEIMDAPAFTMLPAVPPPPLVLPPLTPALRATRGGTTQSLLSIQEYLAALHALIRTGAMVKAEAIYRQLTVRSPAEMRRIMDTNVYNVFVGGWMDQVVPMADAAAAKAEEESSSRSGGKERSSRGPRNVAARSGLEWFLRMSQADVVPDATSYALLVRGLLRAGEREMAVIYLVEAKQIAETQAAQQKQQLLEAPTVVGLEAAGPPALSFRDILLHPALNSELDSELIEPWRALRRDAGVPIGDQPSVPGDGRPGKLALTDSVTTDAMVQAAAATASESQTAAGGTSSVADAQTEMAAVRQELYADAIALPTPTPVDSLGLKLLKDNLNVMRSMPSATTPFSRYALQLKLEEGAYDAAMHKLRAEAESHREGDRTVVRSGSLKRAMWEWHQELTKAIEAELEACAATEPITVKSTTARSDREFYGPLLLQLSAEKLAMVTIAEVLRAYVPAHSDADDMPEGGEVTKINRVVIGVGRAVEDEINAEMLRAKMRKSSEINADPDAELSEMDKLTAYLDERLFTNQRVFNMTVRRLYARLQEQQAALGGDGYVDGTVPTGMSGGQWLAQWPPSSRAKVGAVLLQLLLRVSSIERDVTDPATGALMTVRVPAFHHTYAFVKGKKLGILRYHAAVAEMLASDPVKHTLSPKLLPMVVRPRPWLTYMSGGYLTSRSPCMRIKDNNSEQLAYLRAAAKHNRLNYIQASLDVLGSTPWRINEDVFKTVLEVWNKGDEFADIPPLMNEERRTKLAPAMPEIMKREDSSTIEKTPEYAMARRAYKEKLLEFQTTVKNAYSLRCDTNYKIEVARTFLGMEMYFPHNVDFRGRAYPMPVHLNHMSSDLCRGLMTFAEAKPLGERGWFWLKVHMASLHGYDKQSFKAREEWVTSNLDNILDSADRPLDGKKWWATADDPWQSLATCFEIARAYRSGDPATYKCALPVHQDGTCNGLQHYAALGGDRMGAEQVNLTAGDRPADVYTAVAKQVSELVDIDAAKGNKTAQLIRGKITRKLVKQTVMTNVYGVTFIGARQQIHNRLKEGKEFSGDEMYAIAAYVAKKVFLSIGTIFHGAQQIQTWLNVVARRVSRAIPAAYAERDSANMTSVVWTTPLGLTCVQPYRKETKTQVKTLLQSVMLADPNSPAPVNSMKQRSAFPPNFIHSLDASHMMMTAVACHARGLAFASVHDSYWTHAADVDTMNDIIRDQFVALHSMPIMDNLVREFAVRYKDYVVPASALTSSSPSSPAEPLKNVEPGEEADLGDDDVPPKKRTRVAGGKADIFVPLELPPLPARGDFDVRDVKRSNYFFH